MERLYWDVERLYWDMERLYWDGERLYRDMDWGIKNSPNSCWMDFDLISVGLFVPQIQ